MLQNSSSHATEESSPLGLLIIAKHFCKKYVRNAKKEKILITLAFSQYLNSCYSSRENPSQIRWQLNNVWLQSFIVHDRWPSFTSGILFSVQKWLLRWTFTHIYYLKSKNKTTKSLKILNIKALSNKVYWPIDTTPRQLSHSFAKYLNSRMEINRILGLKPGLTYLVVHWMFGHWIQQEY